MSRTFVSLAPWTFAVACTGEPATEKPAHTDLAPGAAAPEMKWDGVPRDTLVRGMLTDVNNMIYIVGESLSDQETIYLTNVGGFDADFDCEVKVKPQLYKSWSISDDGLVVKIELDPSFSWNDGKPVTAEDMAFTFELVADPIVTSPRLNQTEHMVPGKAPLVIDSTHLEFHFTHAFDRNTMLLHTDEVPVPKHVLENADRASLRGNHINSKDPMENGAFKMVKWERGQQVVLEANDKFSGPETYKPRIKRVILRVIPEYATRLIELETGGIDMMDGLQVADVDRLRKEHPEISFYRRGWRLQDYIAWNLLDQADYKRVVAATPKGEQVDLSKVKPNVLFGDKRVRQALAHAVDMEKIIKDILTSETGEAYARPAIGTITPSMCNAYNDQVQPLAFDPAKAKALLAEAGWTDTNGDGLLDKDGKKFSFTLTTNAGNARRNKASIIIQAQLKSIGVEARLEQIEGNTFFERLRKKDFEASLSGWSASLILDPTDLWHSGSQYQFNFTSYSNPDVDRLIEQGMSEPDPTKSNAAWRELQAKVYEDQPYLFMYWWDDAVAIHHRFKDVKPNILSEVHHIWNWWVPADEVKYPN
jgi:peptide/nickel transport system substrate-binding protein